MQSHHEQAPGTTLTQRRNRSACRLPWLQVLIFSMFCALLLWLWIELTVGERACRKWFRGAEPNLAGVTVRVITPGAKRVATCSDREALAYFNRCRSGAEDWLCGEHATRVRLGASCQVTLHFEGGATCRLRRPAAINRVGIGLSIPGELSRETGWGTTIIPFVDPREPKWDEFLAQLGV